MITLRRLSACCLFVSVAAAMPALADVAVLQRPAELKAEKFSDAQTLAQLKRGDRVDIVKRQGVWVQVRSGKQTGWIILDTPSAVAQQAAGPVGLLALESGRSGPSGLIATTGVRGLTATTGVGGFAKPPSPQIHAMILTIGAYREGIPQLNGVRYDAQTATEIARRMGVTPLNVHSYSDRELTADGMRRAFDDFEQQIAENDQAFIYYSGHGGRQMVNEPGSGERCAVSLIAQDGQPLVDSELQTRLKRISAKAQKVVVFIDACHSGGVTTRSVGKAEYTPKYWSPKGEGNDICSRPSNVVTRGIALAAKSPGSGSGNYAYIAAARDDEISLDQPGKGGVASQAWRVCMAGTAKDLDSSGGLSADELRVCAQERITNQLSNAAGFRPHHVTINGNSSMVLSYAVKDTQAPAAAPIAAAQMPAAPVATVAKASPLAALNDIYGNRDDRRLVMLGTDKPAPRIGRDNVSFNLSSREGGYVYVLMVGSDGETFDLLFPNQIDRNNVIGPGERMVLPRPNWQLAAGGPAGKNTLLAIVADSPRDFAKAGLKPAGPFSAVEAVAAKDIQLVSGTSSSAETTECAAAGQTTRNLAIVKRCSNAYGAALLTLEEVQ